MNLLSDDSESEQEVRRPRIYKQRIDYNVPCLFFERFRMQPWQADKLLNLLGPRLAVVGTQQIVMSPKHKLLSALRYYASNNFYYTTGDSQGIF